MGTLADSLFTVLMSWVRALVNAFWALFSSDHTTVLEFLGKNWMMIAVVIIAAGLVIDWIIWLMRWQPYHLWAQRVRRLLRLEDPEDEEDEEELRAHAAVTRSHRAVQSDEAEAQDTDEYLQEAPLREAAFPLPLPFEPEEEQEAMERAERVPDADLGVYPGMRYDSTQTGEDMGGTRRYPVMHAQQGPGAAEVERRRAEIDAWQLQMQEEARARAQAEREAREAQAAYEAEQARLAREAYEAEQARLAREAYEAEQARLAQAAYEAEQARLAQEEYERQMAEYERQKAQYERDLAEYERQKAEYEAQLAAQAAEPAYDVQEETPAVHRRRAVNRSYSDYVEGETVSELPDAPAWPQMEHTASSVRAQQAKITQEEKTPKDGGLIGRMARMIEPEEEELVSRRTLPPRVDPNDAFHTAKLPVIGGKRRR